MRFIGSPDSQEDESLAAFTRARAKYSVEWEDIFAVPDYVRYLSVSELFENFTLLFSRNDALLLLY